MASRLRSWQRPYDAIRKVGAGRECTAKDGNHGPCRMCHLAEVELQEGETIDNALRRFRRKVLREDIIREVKRHAFYLKPGQKLRVKQALARKRNRKKARRDAE